MFRKFLPVVASIQLCANGVHSAGWLWSKPDAEQAAYSKFNTKWGSRYRYGLTAEEEKDKLADFRECARLRNARHKASEARTREKDEAHAKTLEAKAEALAKAKVEAEEELQRRFELLLQK